MRPLTHADNSRRGSAKVRETAKRKIAEGRYKFSDGKFIELINSVADEDGWARTIHIYEAHPNDVDYTSLCARLNRWEQAGKVERMKLTTQGTPTVWRLVK